MNLQEVLTSFAAFLGGRLTQKKEKLENRGLSCQSLSEICRISEKVWSETHQYNRLSKIEGISLKLKNQKRFLFRPRQIHSSQNSLQISWDSPFKRKRKCHLAECCLTINNKFGGEFDQWEHTIGNHCFPTRLL
jgi:hypothetical protein